MKLDHGEPMYKTSPQPVDLELLDALHAAANKGYRNASAYLAALHNTYPAMAAELRALREQIQMIREYNDALREERNRLRAEAEKLVESFSLLAERTGFEWNRNADPVEWIRKHLEITFEAQAGAIGRLRAEVAELKAKLDEVGMTLCCVNDYEKFDSVQLVKDYLETSQSELATLRAEAARLREALECIPVDLIHAIENGDTGANVFLSTGSCKLIGAALSSTPTTAEWLAARDAEMKRLGAAEELEKAAKTLKEDLEDMNPPEFASRGKVQPGYCEALQDTIDGMLDHAARLRTGV